jgi:DNA-directed RNA polymerase specialized sigma54-like protein
MQRNSEPLLPCNKKQLAQEMGVSLSTFQRLLKKHNLDIPRGIISPDRKMEILKTLGWREKE